MLIKPYIELQQLMERKGYNQKELAAAISRRLNGYSPATLSNRLNGKAPFPVDEIVVIGEHGPFGTREPKRIRPSRTGW